MSEIRINQDELNDPAIDEVINLERSLARTEGEFIEDVKTPLYLNPIFYYGSASMLTALAVWGLTEPFFIDDGQGGIPFVSDYILFGAVAGGIGLAIGLTYGLANRNYKQMVTCGIGGLGVGLGVTILTTILADILFGISSVIAGMLMAQKPVPPDGFPLTGISFILFMCGRGVAWAIVSMGAGMGLGIILKSKKLLLNGLAGGMVGGMLGGLLFDPVDRFLDVAKDDASLSRAVGILAVGLLVGLFIGFFENLSKDAWFLMVKGPLAGKQFNLFKSPMVIGSAPKCDIYLFKDPAIEPKHASVVKSGNKYLIHDESGEGATHVNGRSVDKYILQPGDVISIGDAVLKYNERQKR